MNCAETAKMNAGLHFAVVAVNGSITSSVYAPLEILYSCIAIQQSMQAAQQIPITMEVLSPEGDSFISGCGRRMPADGGLKDLPADAIVFFPGFGMIPPPELPQKLQAYQALGTWLRRQYQRGCTLATGCNGNFLFVEAGLIGDRPVTTSWLYAELFQQRYPEVELDLNSILLDYDRVISVGGILCALDLMLAIVGQKISLEVARLCTKFMLLENRQPSKVPFEQRQTVFSQDPMVKKAIDWIRENLHDRISLDDLVDQVPASKRNLSRRFREATGESPAEYIQRQRIERAKSLLETSDLSIDRIVEQVGYSDGSAFARQFRNHTMMTPREYRERFRIQVIG